MCTRAVSLAPARTREAKLPRRLPMRHARDCRNFAHFPLKPDAVMAGAELAPTTKVTPACAYR